MEHPKTKGDKSTLATMYGLCEMGYALMAPFGENTRYDLVIDDGSQLWRVQCKTGRLRDGTAQFNTASTYGHHPNPKLIRRGYTGEVDYFAVFCPETGGVYLVPIADLPSRSEARLRLEPTRNGQRRHVRFASKYEVARLSTRRAVVIPEPGARAGGSGSSA